MRLMNSVRSVRVSSGLDFSFRLQVSGKQVVDANKYALQVSS